MTSFAMCVQAIDISSYSAQQTQGSNHSVYYNLFALRPVEKDPSEANSQSAFAPLRLMSPESILDPQRIHSYLTWREHWFRKLRTIPQESLPSVIYR
jgi:hypothetical protein